MRTAMEDAGVIFLEEGSEGAGVRLKKLRKPDSDPAEIQ